MTTAEQQKHTDNMVAQQDYHSQPDSLFRYVRDESFEKVSQFLEAGGDAPTVLGKRPAVEAQRPSSRKRAKVASGPSETELRDKRTQLLCDRGPVGELPLHMACLYNKPDVAAELLRQHIALDISLAETFTSAPGVPLQKRAAQQLEEGKGVGGGTPSPFEGENSLHIAVAQGSHPIVDALLTKPSAEQQKQLLLGRATGAFFSPEGNHAFGELPLAFAVSLGREDMVDRLLSDGERASELKLLQQVDASGNTLMHLCVQHHRHAMIDHLWCWHSDDMRWCLTQRNRQDLTPLMLAVRMGDAEAVKWLEVQQRITLWRFGETACELIPLDHLDPILREDAEDRFDHERRWSLLNDIDFYSHSSLLLDGSFAWKLAEAKWKAFAERLFLERFVRVLLGLLLYLASALLDDFSACLAQNVQALILALAAACLGPPPCEPSPDEPLPTESPAYEPLTGEPGADALVAGVAATTVGSVSLRLVLLTTSQLVVVCACCSKLSTELHEWFFAGSKEYWGVRGARFLENFFSVLACSLILAAHAVHSASYCAGWAGFRPVVLTLQAAGALASWSYVSFFLLGFRRTGPFVVMLYEMLVHDVTSYLCVFVAVLAAFLQSLTLLLCAEQREPSSVAEHAGSLVYAMIGDTGKLEGLGESEQPRLLASLVAVYILFASLIMFNTLIAAMNSTYTACEEDAEKRWRLERIRIISSLESEMNSARQLQTAFWVLKPDEEGVERRYLLETSNVSQRKATCA